MTWLTVQQAADALDIGVSAVQKAKERYSYRYVDGKGRGGKVLQIALESLPQAAQDRYHNVQRKYRDCNEFTGTQREEASRKARIVETYKQTELAPDAFVEWYNAEVEPDAPITRKQLMNWQTRFKNGEMADLLDLRGGHNRGLTSIPDEAWELFYSLYMTQQRRSIKLCYDLTLIEHPDIPSVDAFERRIRKIPKIAVVRYREGAHAAENLLPAMERSKLDIESNDIWFSDHHLLDVFVQSPDGQKPIRPWLTVFFDARSNRVMSHVLRAASPSSTAVKKCFRLGVEEHGIPREVYFDNGKDYRAKDFDRDYPMSLVKQLNFNVIYATKYHGQAKTVERFFGTLESRFGKRFDTYTGRDAKTRPECMRIPDSEILTLAPTFKAFEQYLVDYFREYNSTPSRGRDMGGKCPNEVFVENLKTRHVIRDHDALRLLCGNSDERVVNKGGISIKNNTYFHDLLVPHIGEHVIVVFDPENIDKVAVFDMKFSAICTAKARIQTAFRRTTDEDYNRAVKEKKAARAVMKRYKPVRDLSVHEIIARNQLQEKQYEETGLPSEIDHLTPIAQRNAAVLKKTDTTASGRKRPSGEDSVAETLLSYYRNQA